MKGHEEGVLGEQQIEEVNAKFYDLTHDSSIYKLFLFITHPYSIKFNFLQ